jgi:hypothetical protein
VLSTLYERRDVYLTVNWTYGSLKADLRYTDLVGWLVRVFLRKISNGAYRIREPNGGATVFLLW